MRKATYQQVAECQPAKHQPCAGLSLVVGGVVSVVKQPHAWHMGLDQSFHLRAERARVTYRRTLAYARGEGNSVSPTGHEHLGAQHGLLARTAAAVGKTHNLDVFIHALKTAITFPIS